MSQEIESFQTPLKELEVKIEQRKMAEEEIGKWNIVLERRVAERTAELERSKISYLDLFQNNPMPMWVVESRSFKFLSVNEAAIRLYGYSRMAFLAMTLHDITPEEEKNKFLDLNIVGDSYYTGTWRLLKKDGAIIHVEVNANEINFEGATAHLVLPIDITEKIKAIQKQALYASIVNSSDDAIISKTLDGIITGWNRGAETLFGYSGEEALGKNVSMLVPAELLSEEPEIMRKLKQGQYIKQRETIRLKKDGTIVQVSVTLSPLLDSDGNVVGVSKIGRNITERKAEQDQLQKTLKEISGYKYALDESYIIAITDQKGIIKHANDNFCKISKYSAGELIGQDHRIINSGFHSSEFIRNMWVTIANGKIWKGEFRNKTKDGAFYWVDTTIVPFLDENGKPYQYLAIRVDITVRKAAQEALNRSEARFRKIFDADMIGFLFWDSNGEILEANDFFLQMVGYTQKDFHELKLKWKGMTPPEYAGIDLLAMEQIRLSGNCQPFEKEYIRKDGSRLAVLVRAASIQDNNPEKTVAYIMDITQRRKIEEEIKTLNETLEKKVVERTRQLEISNKELEAFSYSVSHDLRAPLRAVSGYAGMLEKGYINLLDANGKRLLDIIQGNAKRMGLLIDDLLAFSKLGRKGVSKSVVDMTALTNAAVDEIGKSTNHKAEIKINFLHAAYADNVLMKQVMVNYILNAVKYSSKKEDPLIEIGSAEVNGRVVYSIKDNGAGFDMHYVHKLFGVFQRLHTNEEFEGTGVGLAIVQRIISKHGGEVWAEGELEKGAIFYFSLPLINIK